MTQALLRQCTALYSLVLIAVNVMMMLYIRAATIGLNAYIFDREMLYRVSYISAMAEWVPLTTLLNGSPLAVMSDRTAFTVSLRAATADDPVKTLALSSGIPTIAYKYSPILDAVMSVAEGEVTTTSTGCPEEYVAIGSCFAVMIPVTLMLVLSIGNMLASRQMVRLARCVVWIGFALLPAAISVTLLAVLAVVQTEGQHNAWQEDMHRSATLYSAMFNVAHSLQSTITTQYLADTLNHVNEHIVGDEMYQVVVAMGADRELSAPLFSEAVFNQGFAKAKSEKMVYSGNAGGYVWASSSLPTVSSLIVVLRKLEPTPNLFDSEYLVTFIITVLFAVGLGVAMLLFAFPMASLGQTGPQPEGASPWDVRLPQHWPAWKLFEVCVYMTVAVIVFTMASARLTTHFARTSALQDYYLDKIDHLEELQKVSDLLGQCYADILEGKDWNSDFLDYISRDITADERIYLYQFYHELTTTIQREKYFIYSGGDYMSKEPPSLWPLLTNMPAIKTFLSGNLQESDDLMIFMHWMLRYDNAVIVAILTNDKAFLINGDATLEQGLEDSFQTITTTDLTLEGIRTSIEMLQLTAKPYVNIMEAYDAQGITIQTYVDLFSSELGKEAVGTVEMVSTIEVNRLPPNKFINLTYPWEKFTSLYVGLAFFLLALFFTIFEALYAVLFYGKIKLNWLHQHQNLEREPDKVCIESHDYTSPSSLLVLNMFSLRRSVRLLIFSSACFIAITVMVITIFLSRSALNVTMLELETKYFQSSLVPICDRAGGSAMVEMSLALWSQAYLSLQPEHINRAISLSSQWTNFRPVSWTGGEAAHDPGRFSSAVISDLLQNVQKVSVQTSLLRKEPSLQGIYSDELYLLGLWDEYFHFAGYETCFSGASYYWENYAGAYLNCLVVNPVESCFTDAELPLTGLSNVCRGRGLPDDFFPYIHRIAELQMRSFEMYNHNEMASLMGEMTPQVNAEVQQIIDLLSEKFGGMKTEMSMGLPWVGVLYGWLVAPFVFLIFHYARKLHISLYFN